MIQAGKIETEQSRRKLQTELGTTSDTLRNPESSGDTRWMWWSIYCPWRGDSEFTLLVERGLGEFPFSFYATANEVLALLLASEINVNYITLTISAFMLGKMFWWRPGEALRCSSFASFAYHSPSHSVPKSVWSRLCCSLLTGWVTVTYKLNGKIFWK